MTARYILRLDDACHTMDKSRWQSLENLLDDFAIKPIAAVVPDNHDPKLNVNTFDPTFWNKVRSWQEKGWTIAMHGHRHVMHPTKAKLVLPFYERSEFGGLSYEQQAEKVRQSWRLFSAQDVAPTVWVAPAHCFDLLTLKAIHDETPIRIVSDGIARNPYFEHDFFWVPQQLWEPSNRRTGLWTVCLHPNTMAERDVSRLREMIERTFFDKIVRLEAVTLLRSGRTFIDHIYGTYFWQRRRAYKCLDMVRSIFRTT